MSDVQIDATANNTVPFTGLTDLTGCVVYMAISAYMGSARLVLKSSTVGAQITVTVPATGSGNVFFVPADFAAGLLVEGCYVYTMWKTIGGVETVIDQGTIVVRGTVIHT